jgi:hypothetical protein
MLSEQPDAPPRLALGLIRLEQDTPLAFQDRRIEPRARRRIAFRDDVLAAPSTGL